MKGKLRLYYDREGDFLEISMRKPSSCYAENIADDVFLRLDNETNEVKSIGILKFSSRKDKIDLPIDIEMNKTEK